MNRVRSYIGHLTDAYREVIKVTSQMNGCRVGSKTTPQLSVNIWPNTKLVSSLRQLIYQTLELNQQEVYGHPIEAG